jgi:hypothetical protein
VFLNKSNMMILLRVISECFLGHCIDLKQRYSLLREMVVCNINYDTIDSVFTNRKKGSADLVALIFNELLFSSTHDNYKTKIILYNTDMYIVYNTSVSSSAANGLQVIIHITYYRYISIINKSS